jgi:hypothetical protein
VLRSQLLLSSLSLWMVHPFLGCSVRKLVLLSRFNAVFCGLLRHTAFAAAGVVCTPVLPGRILVLFWQVATCSCQNVTCYWAMPPIVVVLWQAAICSSQSLLPLPLLLLLPKALQYFTRDHASHPLLKLHRDW